MELLSKEAEDVLLNRLYDRINEVITVIEKREPKRRYLTQKEVLSEFGFSLTFLNKLQVLGLKRVKFDDDGRKVYYDRLEIERLFKQYEE